MSTLETVSTTMFITLGARATESQSARPIIDDPKAVEIWEALQPELAASDSALANALAGDALDPRLVVSMSLRARRFDRYARDFLAANPTGVIVNLGCGLDTRYFRIDDGRLLFFDLDLPPVIELKRRFVQESDRYRLIASSVLDFGWMEAAAEVGDRPMLFLAEGLFMYLPEEAVRELVCRLQARFPGSELVCEVFSATWLEGWRGRATRRRLQRSFLLDEDSRFRFGIRGSRDLEDWHAGIEFLDDWSYFDEDEPKLGAMRHMGRFNALRHLQWTVHYRLN